MQMKRSCCGAAPGKRFGNKVCNLTHARPPCNHYLSGSQYPQVTHSACIQQAFVLHSYPLGVSYSTDCTGTCSQRFRYLKLINLSLYLVNMLPVPALDGFHFLAALLNVAFHQTRETGNIDLEALGNNDRHGAPLPRIIQATMSMSTTVSIASCVLLGAIEYVLH